LAPVGPDVPKSVQLRQNRRNCFDLSKLELLRLGKLERIRSEFSHVKELLEAMRERR